MGELHLLDFSLYSAQLLGNPKPSGGKKVTTLKLEQATSSSGLIHRAKKRFPFARHMLRSVYPSASLKFQTALLQEVSPPRPTPSPVLAFLF